MQFILSISVLNVQKRFYTRGKLRGIRKFQVAKIPTFYGDWLFEMHKGKGGVKDIHCIAVIFVDLL